MVLNWFGKYLKRSAMPYALLKWEYLLCNTKFTLFTDHQNSVYLNMEGSPKAKRWKLDIQECDFDFVHIAQEKNDLANRFSRS